MEANRIVVMGYIESLLETASEAFGLDPGQVIGACTWELARFALSELEDFDEALRVMTEVLKQIGEAREVLEKSIGANTLH